MLVTTLYGSLPFGFMCSIDWLQTPEAIGPHGKFRFGRERRPTATMRRCPCFTLPVRVTPTG